MSQQIVQRLADDIARIVRDYRNEDGITLNSLRVLRWVNQFEQNDRLFILQELKHLLTKRYVSKAKAKAFLKESISVLARDYNYDSPLAFLRETVFLDLQENGKSQKVLLTLLDEVIRREYGISLSACGTRISRNFIYVDDVLCTGNTIFYDLKEWLEQSQNGETTLTKIHQSGANVICLYIFAHLQNYDKLKWRFHYTIPGFEYEVYADHWIDNRCTDGSSKLDFLFPVREGQSQAVLDYFARLQTDAEGVFREANLPPTEEFFSSPSNRTRFENILLNKGLEILSSVSVQKQNVRPLGFTLPTHKNFGFGTLCFTWRNIPNNTPLVFWYATPTWMPLFENKR